MVGDQALGVDSTGLCGSPALASGGRDVLLLRDVPEHLTYRALHDLVKPYGDVARIRLIYETDGSNRCYVTFTTAVQARSAFDASGTFGFSAPRPELLASANVAESDSDYVPNIFERVAEEASKGVRQAPTPRWFLAYFRGGKGNFIRACQFVEREFGTVPKENLRRYGKALLIRAKDLTQAKMLLNFRCDPQCMFDAIRPHRTFNYCRGIVFNYDLWEFPEEEIRAMCPQTVQKVWKVNGRGNMVVLTFFGSVLPDYVQVGPLHLRVKPFLDRPLQCFNCYEFGHGRKHCTSSSRCGRCSVLGSHGIDNCEADPYCFHCRSDHQLRSRDCPRYRLEQDVLHLANTSFISIGSARRELSYRQGRSGEAKSYSAAIGSRLPLSQSPPSLSVPLGVPVRNTFSVLEGSGDGTPAVPDLPPSRADSCPTPAPLPPRSPRRRDRQRATNKRQHGSADSVELLQLPPTKVAVGRTPRGRSADRVPSTSAVTSDGFPVRSASLGRTDVPDVPVTVDMEVSQGGPLPQPLGSPVSPDPVLSDRSARPVSPLPSGGVSPTKGAVVPVKVVHRPKVATGRSSPSSRSRHPLVRASGLPGSRLVTVPFGEREKKGKSLKGTRTPH